MPHFRPCRHLFTDGHQCGSPALRGEPLCFNHHSARRPLQHQTIHGYTRVALPEPLDLHAIQRGLAELLRLTAAQAIDLPLAAALHRQLATAAQNLARIERSDSRALALNPHRAPVTDYTNHPTLGTLALEPQLASQPATQPSTGPQTPPDLQTQPPSNQDLETSGPNRAEAPAAPSPAPETRAAQPGTPLPTPPDLQTQPPSNQDLETSPENPSEASTPEAQAPLPDPVHRFTLPPVIENVQSKEELAAAERVYAQALQSLAQGIHARAQTRAKLHAELYPLVDDTLADERVLDLYPQLHPILHQLQDNQTPTPTHPLQEGPCL